MGTRTRRLVVARRRIAGGIVVSGVLALAVGCSSGSSGDASSASRSEAASDVAPGAGAPSVASATQSSPSFAVDAVNAPADALGREVVSTATMTVAVLDIGSAREEIAAAVESAGGYVHSEQGQYGDTPSATMTVKVPPDRFRSTLATIGELGEVERQEVSTDDVTEQVIDLDSRIASAEASVVRVRGFLDRAANVLEISSFEGELLRRETDLEKLRGQKRSLDARIDLATIVATVQPLPAIAAPAEPTDLPAFAEGLAAGSSAFVAFVRVGLAVLGALLPFAPVLVAGGVVVWVVRRRSRPAPV